MQVGMIGLGRMGMNMVRRLLRGGHEVFVYNRSRDKSAAAAEAGAVATATLEELVGRLAEPRVLWLMLPAGEVTESHLHQLTELLAPGDLVVDGGNAFYKDDVRRAAELAPRGVHYVDAGVSGGIWGLELGYCTMVGGEASDFRRIRPLLESLAPENGFLHCGGVGAGHFVKMVHNGIEYAMMEAYGEGFEILKASPYGAELKLDQVANLWNQGSVVRSWLLELLASALGKDPELQTVTGYVEDSGEGRWTVIQAVESGVSATAIAHALFKRFQSRQAEVFSDKVLSALRREFGGHATQPPAGPARKPGAGAGGIAAARPGQR